MALVLLWIFSVMASAGVAATFGSGTARAEDEPPPEVTAEPTDSEEPPQFECTPAASTGPLPDGSQSISGTVTDGVVGLEGISVIVTAASGGSATTTTNPLGEYQLTGLGDGTYTVGFHDDNGPYVSGFYNSTTPPVLDPGDATPVELTGSGAIGVDAALQSDTPGSISGTISNHLLQPVNGVQVRAEGAYLPLVGCAVSSSSGSFSMPTVSSGLYRLSVTASGYPEGYYSAGAPGSFSTHFTDATPVTVDGDISGLAIDFPELFDLSGYVLDGGDNPVEGFSISASEIVPGASRAGGSGSDGAFVISGLPAGDYHVQYSDGNGRHKSGWYGGDGVLVATESLAATVTVPGPSIELLAEAAPTISGRITDESGAGVPFVGMNVCDESQEICATGPGTDADGYYTAWAVMPADYYILLYPNPGLLPMGGYITSPGGFADPDFDNALAISGGVTDVTGIDAVIPDGGRVEARITTGGQHLDYPYVSFCRTETICPDQTMDYDAELDALSPVLWEGTYYVFVDLDSDGIGVWLVDGGTASADFGDATPVAVTANNVSVISSEVPPAGTETPVGNPEIVVDDGQGTTIKMDFVNVSPAGTTTVTRSDSGIAPPSGFQLGVPATYYDFESTAEFDEVTICIPYGSSSWISESNLRLFHYDDTIPGWEDITVLPVNTVDQIICGVTDSLSPFVLAERTMTFSGFFQPVDNGVLNRMKAGAAVPVKFSLGGDFGLGIFSAGSPTTTVVNCANPIVDSVEETVPAGTSHLTYDAVAGRYIYVFKTQKSWSGACRLLTLTFTDGTSRSALFQFTK